MFDFLAFDFLAVVSSCPCGIALIPLVKLIQLSVFYARPYRFEGFLRSVVYRAGICAVANLTVDNINRRISRYLFLKRLRMLHIQVEGNMKFVSNELPQSPPITATHKSDCADK